MNPLIIFSLALALSSLLSFTAATPNLDDASKKYIEDECAKTRESKQCVLAVNSYLGDAVPVDLPNMIEAGLFACQELAYIGEQTVEKLKQDKKGKECAQQLESALQAYQVTKTTSLNSIQAMRNNPRFMDTLQKELDKQMNAIQQIKSLDQLKDNLGQVSVPLIQNTMFIQDLLANLSTNKN